MLRPGFEPGSPARKAGILDRTIFGRERVLFYRSLPEHDVYLKGCRINVSVVEIKKLTLFLNIFSLVQILFALCLG